MYKTLITNALLLISSLQAEPLKCDLSEYTPIRGLAAAVENEMLAVEWQGEDNEQLRLRLAIASGQPVIRDIAVRRSEEDWMVLAENLTPEFQVTTGRRRISNQQLSPLRDLGVEITPEIIEKEKWNVFWDAPLSVPGLEGTNPGLPRSEEEIRRALAVYRVEECKVHRDGLRLEISFPGVSLGVFSGRLQFTVYRDTNLIRQEIIAKTEEPSVAYQYRAGLKGFRIGSGSRVTWRDTSRAWQTYQFGGAPNDDPVALRARNRLAIVETNHGSIVVFPPPHKFFWAREIELNLGYVWYRKDGPNSFSVGVRQGEREGMFPPYGNSDELWERRVRQSRRFAQGNFALYNAPPGTWQRMAAYFFVSPSKDPLDAQSSVLAFTRGDRYKELPGYKVAVSHFHTHFAEQLMDNGSLDFQPPWISAFRALGINIAMMSDFHGDGHPDDPGPLRFLEQHAYFEGCRRHSDRDFLIMPGEEPNAHLGGHYTMVFPRPVYWTKVREEGQSFAEKHEKYGIVYHVGSAAEELDLLRREGGLVWQSHPRTKGSTGYPDAIRKTAHFQADRFLGAAFQLLPADLSERRLCESRCFGTLDDMNNWAGPKYLIAEGDTYTKYPEYEIYSGLIVNYVKLDRVPAFDEDWSPVTKALERGDFFVSSGEVLFHQFSMDQSGRVLTAELEWTFPLDFVEIVHGNGKSVDRQIIPTTDLPAFGKYRFDVPFDPRGKKWVRFAAWDSAGNGAFTQPLQLK